MDVTMAALVVALVVVVLLGVLLWRSQDRNAPARATLKFGDLFTAEVHLGSKQEAQAENAIREAERQRGVPVQPSPVLAGDEATTTLARILWVDDHPDNNLYEIIALENVGRFVTVATSTEAALFYLRELDFAAAITDIERAGDPTAGESFIQRARASGHQLPIAVYTSNAAVWRHRMLDHGAQAVVDLPGDLIREVDRLIARHRGSTPSTRAGSIDSSDRTA